MKREIDDKTILDKFAEEFCEVVDKYCRYFVCSGFRAIASGRSRGTEDIDMIIEKLSKNDFLELHNGLVRKGFECIQSQNSEGVFDYLDNSVSVRYVRKGEHLPEMEIHFAKDVLDEIQLNERIKVPLTTLNIWFAPLEGDIAFKEELLKSDKDMKDARHLRIVYDGEFTEEKIDEFKKLIKKIRLKNEK